MFRFLMLALLALPAAAQEMKVPLQFAAREAAPAALTVKVEDARGTADPQTIGRGADDEGDSYAILADGDVMKFIGESLQSLATPGDRTLTLRITRFYVDSRVKAIGSIYTADVKATYVLTDADGNTISEGETSGSAHRYGRPRSVDDCNGALSEALQKAFAGAVR